MTVMDFLKRHRNKIFVTVGITASAYMLTRYVQSKFVELQERIVAERLAKDNLERRFEQNQRDATFTILALLPTLGAQVLSKYDVEAIKKELQALRGPAIEQVKDSASETKDISQSETDLASSGVATDMEASTVAGSMANSALLPLETSTNLPLDESYVKTPSKSQLWYEIKIQSLTRGLTLIYGVALLVLITRIQLNVLGRRTYVSSVEEIAGVSAPIDSSTELNQVHRQYLTFSWWLLNKGWESLAQRVNKAVEVVVSEVDVREEVTFSQISAIIGRIQYGVDHPDATEGGLPSEETLGKSFLGVLLPPQELETYVLGQAPGSVVAPDTVDGELRDMLNETADLIESPNASEVLARLVHAGLTVLMSKLSPLFGQDCADPSRFASVLAAVTRQAHQLAGGHPMTNDYVDAMVEEPQLDALCAVIYTNF